MSFVLLKKFMIANLNACIEFRFNFFSQVIAKVLQNATFYGTMLYLAHTFSLGNLSYKEVLFAITIAQLAYQFGLASFGGINSVQETIISGDFDKLLIRPASIYTQILITKIRPMFFLELVTTTILLSLNEIRMWPLIFLFGLTGGIILHFITFLYSILPFFIEHNYSNHYFDTMVNFLFYPPDIFNYVGKFIALFVFPGAMISYGPLIILQQTNFIWYYSSFVILLPILFFIIFNIGLKKYKSAGY